MAYPRQASSLMEWDGQSAQKRATGRLRDWIDKGVLVRGRRLPPERVLAEKLKVARATLRASLKELEQDGVIQPHGSRGRVVADHDSPVAGPLMSSAVAVLTQTGELQSLSGMGSGGWSHHIELGLIQAARRAGLHTMLIEPQGMRDGQRITRLIAERPRGVIAVRDAETSSPSVEDLNRLKEAGIPVAVYGPPENLPGFDTVSSDHEAGAYELTKLLIHRGCRKVLRYWGMIGYGVDRAAWLAQRDRGHERACREAGLRAIPPVVVKGHWLKPDSPDWFKVATWVSVGSLMPYLTGPDAVDGIMVISDGLVPLIAAGCQGLGKQPGRDVALVGYDNYWTETPERPLESSPPLATMDKLNAQCGAALMQLLEDRIAGRLPAEPQHRVVAPKLIRFDPSGSIVS